MKRFLCTVLTLLITISGAVSYAAMSESDVIDHYLDVKDGKITNFSDISSYPWAVTPITELAKRGIVNGTGEDMFSPSKSVSRYEYIKMITSVCGIVDKTATSSYIDTDNLHWAYTYVSSAKDAGILDIYSDKILNGNAPITREEMAYLAVKAMQYGGFNESKNTINEFTDKNLMSDYAVEPVAILAKLNVINGRGDGTFAPKDFATRAESAKIIYNVLMITESNF